MMVRRTRATFPKAMPEMFFRQVTADTIVLFDRPAAGAVFQCSCYSDLPPPNIEPVPMRKLDSFPHSPAQPA